MKKYIYIFLLMAIGGCGNPESAEKPHDYPLSAVDIKNVAINDDFWLPKISIIQDSTIHYAFEKCEEEGRMDNFLIAGGKKEGKTRGKMPFDDTDVYKIIEGASNTLISKPNPALEVYLDSIIEIIKVGQEPDGYLTTWFTIDRMNPPASWVKPAEKRWEQEISSHELYNSGHLFEAAATHFLATGKRNFLDIALKNADLLVDNFGPDKLHIPPGHQIVETGLIKLYRITQNKKYLDLAKFFLDIRGDSTSHSLFGDYSQDHLPVTKQKEAVGHAVRAMYMYAAMTDIAALYQDSDYRAAVDNIWSNTTQTKTYLTGGLGAKHEGEAFGGNYELPNLTAYNETCAAIGSVYWNQRLFLLTGESKYYDVIERTLYNGLIAGISVDGKKFFYPNPLESDGKYTFNQGACTRSSWFDCSCCPTNMIRFIPSLPGLVYATKEEELYVNLYISSQAKVNIGNQPVEVIQQTDYPWKGNVTISLNPSKKSAFTLKMRLPGWANNQVIPGELYAYTSRGDERIQLSVNGATVPIKITQGYIEISREWDKGDKIELIFPMVVRKVKANGSVNENAGKVAFEYGPIVYCGEAIDNPELSAVRITDNDSWTVKETALLSNKVNVLEGKISEQSLTLIPYYLWSNRGINGMQVWFPTE
ncbi:MAG: glycoside hydrolase family 127 protein [Bacteroidia bacterium]|nr:glycoside hydrolase family 127 protein [Bacteroidia bacterium]